MKRYIRLDENNMIVTVRYGVEIVDGEIESEFGEANDIMLEDGTFIQPEQIEEETSDLEKRIRNLEAIIEVLLSER